jgi:uncharacterized membrane protein YqgA involved in biofilm formation
VTGLTGTFLNVGAVLVGTALGLLLGARLPERVRTTTMAGLGLAVLAVGAQLALRSNNALVLLGSVVIGGVLGALLGVDEGLERLGAAVERRLSASSSARWGRVSEAFVTSSLVFCVGPMTIVGSIQDGLTGDYSVLALKAGLDLIASTLFASTLGPGVLLSAATVLVYQGGLALAASSARQLLTDDVVREMTATGGVLILGIGLRLLDITRVPVGNLLPALAVAPCLAALAARLSS